ncbi:MAG: bifunctional enoyl-CoA hydratase/phosphate acetyltransferase [Bacteroidetes bacterium]|nr:bifunctional enoyl-CoA hydratase/phosphate acetyltransferase [Bacteroidota bacterium]MBL6944585.1 bifunctional enoyl-CoA hydratase/phosphate acetyltransferase [Bacteroidales bacterium]
MITHLSSLVELAKSKPKRKIAVAAAGDYHVLQAIAKASAEGLVEPILVGEKTAIKKIAKEIGFNLRKIEIIDIDDDYEASLEATKLISHGKAEILMKGLVSTGLLLKAILDKDFGLRTGTLLSHVALFETPYYHKLLGLTDAAMNVDPGLEEKIDIIKNAVKVFHRLSNLNPKVAILGSVETINPKMEATMHAATISMMNYRKQIKGCIIDGPLALDGAISKRAAELKNITSDVAGDADLILAPDINGANILYKSLNFLGGAMSAAVIMGAKVPVVLTSRGDTEKSKFLSIALAAAIA